MSIDDQSLLEKSSRPSEALPADYEPRTIKVNVVAIKNIEIDPPIERKLIYTNFKTIDLSRPQEWNETNVDSFLNYDTRIVFTTKVTRESHAFYEGEIKTYLRFDFSVTGRIIGFDPIQKLLSAWIDPASSYAGLKHVIGPLAPDPVHFIFTAVFQR